MHVRCDNNTDLNRMLLLSVGSEWIRSSAMLIALALVSALKSSTDVFHGAKNPILKCSGLWSCWFASVVVMATVAITTSADVIVVSAFDRAPTSPLVRQAAPTFKTRQPNTSYIRLRRPWQNTWLQVFTTSFCWRLEFPVCFQLQSGEKVMTENIILFYFYSVTILQ